MIRIILPLAILAATFFGPWATAISSNSELGEREVKVVGGDYLQPTVDCLQNSKISVFGDCAPLKGTKGLAIAATAGLSAAAAALGVIGLLPFIGRLTSFVTLIAGGVALGTMAFVVIGGLTGGSGLPAPGSMWGAYVTGVLGLITLVSGLSGMRGN